MSKDSEEDQLVYRSDDDVQFIQQVRTNLLPDLQSGIPDKYLKSNYKPNRPWTDHQLKLLRKYYNKFPNQWDLITQKIGTRTKGCVMNKYKLLKQKKQWSRLTNYGQLNPRGRPWSQAEDQQLLKYAKIHNNDWKLVHLKLGRSVMSCKTRFRVLKEKQKKQRWKKEQIELLRQLGSTLQSDWKIAQNLFPNRTAADCRQKYERILELQQAARLRQQKKKQNQKNQINQIVDQQEQFLRNRMINAIQTNLEDLQQSKSKRKTARKWIQQEDNLLIYLFKKKYSWATISAAMINRTMYQCQRRYCAIQQEKPIIITNNNEKIQKQLWTKQQQDLLLKLYQQQPNQWKQITIYFPGKTQNQVQKKFHQLQSLMKSRYGLQIWTKQHRETLQQIIQKYPGDMDMVYSSFPDHNRQDIRKKYLVMLKEKVRKDRQLQINTQYRRQNTEPTTVEFFSNASLKNQVSLSSRINQCQIQIQRKKAWTKKQDFQLLKSQKLYKQDWNKIKLLFPERTVQEVICRFNELQSKLEGFKRQWTYEEDIKLKQLYSKYGQQWNLIKQQIPMRTLIQLKKRLKELQTIIKSQQIIQQQNEQEQSVIIQRIVKNGQKSVKEEFHQKQIEERLNNNSLLSKQNNLRNEYIQQNDKNQQLSVYESPKRKKVKIQIQIQSKTDSFELPVSNRQQNQIPNQIVKFNKDSNKAHNTNSDLGCSQCQNLKKQILQIKQMLANLVGMPE